MRGEYSTKQRDAILSFLKENNAHVSASDIIRHLKEQGYSVSTATVYRTLDKFEKEGILRKMVIGQGTGACYQFIDRSDCSEHFHLKCVKCGALIHLSCEFLESLENHIYSHHGFTVSSGKTVIYGTCANCSDTPVSCDSHCHCHGQNDGFSATSEKK